MLAAIPNVGEDADFSREQQDRRGYVFLLDTDVISEIRKGPDANPGVCEFFAQVSRDATDLYLSAVTIGELRQGVERIRHRGDAAQARRLERWLGTVTTIYSRAILSFDEECAQVWGRLVFPTLKTRSISKLRRRRSFTTFRSSPEIWRTIHRRAFGCSILFPDTTEPTLGPA